MNAAAEPAISARGLTVAYGARVALDDVDLDVPRGASVALLGPNGAGKSTLLHAAVGLARARTGAITVRGEHVAFVPQRLHVEPTFPATVADVVAMGRYGELGLLRRFRERDRALVCRGLEELEIGHLAGRRFGLLSGGERQRALLAQAVAQDADVMLLDEPFSGVDAPTRESVRRLLAAWRERGRTVVVATHDVASASRDYDLALCLNRRVVGYGPAAQTCTEEVLDETFAGRTLRVGDTLLDVSHHHHGAG